MGFFDLFKSKEQKEKEEMEREEAKAKILKEYKKRREEIERKQQEKTIAKMGKAEDDLFDYLQTPTFASALLYLQTKSENSSDMPYSEEQKKIYKKFEKEWNNLFKKYGDSEIIVESINSNKKNPHLNVKVSGVKEKISIKDCPTILMLIKEEDVQLEKYGKSMEDYLKEINELEMWKFQELLKLGVTDHYEAEHSRDGIKIRIK